VQALGTNGCIGNDCVEVIVEAECGEIFVPTAFSPNGDGQNDLECVMGNCVTSIEFTIYDRWGEKVFESTSSKHCWDGMFRGEKLNTAVFAYYLRAVLTNGKEVIRKGNINLIR
jgi:gliding motility-associated-like protein